MKINIAVLAALSLQALLAPARAPEGGAIVGSVTFTGTPAKPTSINMSKEPACVKLNGKPLLTENVVTGIGNALQNVVVYVSAGPPDNSSAPAAPALFEQKNCHYTTHVLAFRLGQDVSISNADPFNHNIHPMPKLNREWNRIQLPGTPPFSYSYEKEEFIPIKCNIHSWMQAYFVVLKTTHFAVTAEDGKFALQDLPPGKYTLTAWHETYGTQSREITISDGQTAAINFNFQIKP